MATLDVGERFGRYTIVRRIAKGGMATVYEAIHHGLSKRVALKLLDVRIDSGTQAVQRFLLEGRAAARVRHPNVVEVFDVDTHDGIPFLVMEYLEGSDLGQTLDREGRLGAEQTLAIMLPVLAAVATAHAESVIHRDLKPENIFLASTADDNIRPKILDFGVSKLLTATDDMGLTQERAVIGTPYYMSPEQISDSRSADALSDQYSLGVILYECLGGQRPYEGDNVVEIVHSIVTQSLVPLRDLAPDTPTGLREAVERSMHSDRARRFASVAEFARALLPFASAEARAAWESTFAATETARPRTKTADFSAKWFVGAPRPADGAVYSSAPGSVDAERTASKPAVSARGQRALAETVDDAGSSAAQGVGVTSARTTNEVTPAARGRTTVVAILAVAVLGGGGWWFATQRSRGSQTTIRRDGRADPQAQGTTSRPPQASLGSASSRAAPTPTSGSTLTAPATPPAPNTTPTTPPPSVVRGGPTVAPTPAASATAPATHHTGATSTSGTHAATRHQGSRSSPADDAQSGGSSSGASRTSPTVPAAGQNASPTRRAPAPITNFEKDHA